MTKKISEFGAAKKRVQRTSPASELSDNPRWDEIRSRLAELDAVRSKPAGNDLDGSPLIERGRDNTPEEKAEIAALLDELKAMQGI